MAHLSINRDRNDLQVAYHLSPVKEEGGERGWKEEMSLALGAQKHVAGEHNRGVYSCLFCLHLINLGADRGLALCNLSPGDATSYTVYDRGTKTN